MATVTVQQQLLTLVENNQLRIGLGTILDNPKQIRDYLALRKKGRAIEIMEHIVDRDKFRQDINREFQISLSEETFAECTSFFKLVSKIKEITGKE